MTYQELCQLADREVATGVHDEAIMIEARAFANGSEVMARERYWRLRASAIETEAKRRGEHADSYYQELKARVEGVISSKRRWHGVYGWLWAILTYVLVAGACVFGWAAKAARRTHSPHMYAYSWLALGCLVLSIVFLALSRRNTRRA